MECMVVTVCEKWLAEVKCHLQEPSPPVAALQSLTTINQALAVVDPALDERCQTLQQAAKEASMTFQETGSKNALQSCLQEFLSPDFKPNLMAAKKLQGCYDKARCNHNPSTLSLLAAARVRAWDCFVDGFVEGTSGDVLSPALELVTSTLEDPPLLQVCGGAEAQADADSMARLSSAFEALRRASEQMVAAVESGDATGGKALLPMVEALETLQKSCATEAAFHKKEFKEGYAKLQSHGAEFCKTHSANVTKVAAASAQKFLNKARDVGCKLEKAAGGADKCKSWYSDAPPADKLKTAVELKQFLQGKVSKVDGKRIEQGMLDALKAPSKTQPAGQTK